MSTFMLSTTHLMTHVSARMHVTLWNCSGGFWLCEESERRRCLYPFCLEETCCFCMTLQMCAVRAATGSVERSDDRGTKTLMSMSASGRYVLSAHEPIRTVRAPGPKQSWMTDRANSKTAIRLPCATVVGDSQFNSCIARYGNIHELVGTHSDTRTKKDGQQTWSVRCKRDVTPGVFGREENLSRTPASAKRLSN